MDRIKAEVMIYGHCCPQCYPERIGMVRRLDNVDILMCERCGFEIDDNLLMAPYVSMEEITKNYLNLIKQVLLNTKSDFHKFSKMKTAKNVGEIRRKRAKRELRRIRAWIKISKILNIVAQLGNMDHIRFKERVEKEMIKTDRYAWSILFKKF
jgi:Zn ribbon nucleic-acid-binding protein